MWSSRSPLALALTSGRFAWLVTVAALASGHAARAQTTPIVQAAPPAAAPPSTENASRKVIVWSGASLFALSYLASAYVATTSYPDDAATTSTRGLLWIPAVGPLLYMGSASTPGEQALVAVDGVAQLAGLAVFFYGLALPRSVPAAHGDGGRTVQVSVSPFVTRGASGAAVVGTF